MKRLSGKCWRLEGRQGQFKAGGTDPTGTLKGGGGSLTPLFFKPPSSSAPPPPPPHRAKPPNRLSAWTPLANGEGCCPPPCVPDTERWNRDRPGAALAQTTEGTEGGVGGVRIGQAGEREGTRGWAADGHCRLQREGVQGRWREANGRCPLQTAISSRRHAPPPPSPVVCSGGNRTLWPHGDAPGTQATGMDFHSPTALPHAIHPLHTRTSLE